MSIPISQATRYKSQVTLDAGDDEIELNFPVKTADELVVRRIRAGTETILTLNTHYTVASLDTLPGARVVLSPVAEQGDIYDAWGATAIERATVFANGGAYNPDQINADFERQIMVAQELRRDIDRALKTDEAGGAYEAGDARITGLADPIGDQDAATKNYVQDQLSGDLIDEIEAFVEAAGNSAGLAEEWAQNPEDTAITGAPGQYSALHHSAKAAAERQAAGDSADLAEEWAQNPENTAITDAPGQYSALHHSAKAAAQRVLAEAARNKAAQWAEEPENGEVETGQYSALHHAAKAAAERALAEAARDAAIAALVAGDIYRDETLAEAIVLGLAATSDTETFWATGDDVDYIALYLNSSGSEVYQTQVLKTLLETDPVFNAMFPEDFVQAGIAFPFVDAGGRMPAYYDFEGQLHAQLAEAPGEITLSSEFAYAEWLPSGELNYGRRYDGSSWSSASLGPPLLNARWAMVADDGVQLITQRLDGTFAVGPRHEIDWLVYVDGGDAWMVADGYAARQITFTGDVKTVRYEGRQLSIGRATGVTNYALTGEVNLPAGVTGVWMAPIKGQSVSVGAASGEIISAVNPNPRVVMANAGIRVMGTIQMPNTRDNVLIPDNVKSLVPAYETAYGDWMETPATQLGVEFIENMPDDVAVVVGCYGFGSSGSETLAFGTQPFANLLISVEHTRLAVLFAGYEFLGVVVAFDQGEGDISSSEAERATYLETLQADLTASIQAIIGGDAEVILSNTQTSSATNYGYGVVPGMVLGQLSAALANPGKILCPGGKYHVNYVDGAHVDGAGAAIYGTGHGYLIAQAVTGGASLPLHVPEPANRVGTTVSFAFYVPEGTVFEVNTTIVTNPGNYGISWHDAGDGNSPWIVSATHLGDGEWEVELDMVPTGSNPKIGIAATGTVSAQPGPSTGMRSNCCAVVTGKTLYDGSPLRLWAAHQLIPVVS